MSWSIVTLCVCGSKRLQSGCPFSALAFYTEVLGFTKRRDVPVGDNFWLTVVSPESPDGPELLLEHPAVKPYRDALVEDGIPLAQFAVDDVEAEHARLTSNGVVFTQPPTDIGTAVVAVFDDTCGNLIQLIEEKPDENHDDAFNIETSTPPEISVA